MNKLKYEQKLDEYEITSLDHPDLADGFKTAAKEFEAKRAKNELSDEEITKEDEKLLQLFNDLHIQKSEDNEETKKMKAENLALKGKEEVSKTKDVNELKILKEEYKESPDVVKLINDKISAIQAYTTARDEVDNAAGIETFTKLKEKYAQYPDLVKAIDKKIVEANTAQAGKKRTVAEEEILNTKDIKTLTALKEKHSQYPDLVKAIDTKINKLNLATAANSRKTLKEKLLAQKEWSYSDLKDLGINATGENMTVEGVSLERQYMFKVYHSKPA